MIKAVITMGKEHETVVSGKTIEEVMEKIKNFHTMSEFEIEHFKKKNTLKQQLNSGWYFNPFAQK